MAKTDHEMENTINLLRQSEQAYSKLLEFLPVPAIAHSFGLITYVNRATLSVLGLKTMDQVIGEPIYRFIDKDHYTGLKQQFQKLQRNPDAAINFEECMLVGANGRKVCVEASSMVIKIDDYKMVLTVFHDITYRRKEEELFRNMAYVDPLTQLMNRRYMEEVLQKVITNTDPFEQSFYLMFIDLDGFKKVNDTLGHGAGDEVLKVATHRLTHSVRISDVVSRFAGDEFIVLLPDVQLEEAISIAQRILLAMEATMIVNGHLVNVTASIGISSYPEDGETTEMLIKHADEAMYLAKQSGKNNYHVY